MCHDGIGNDLRFVCDFKLLPFRNEVRNIINGGQTDGQTDFQTLGLYTIRPGHSLLLCLHRITTKNYVDEWFTCWSVDYFFTNLGISSSKKDIVDFINQVVRQYPDTSIHYIITYIPING